MFSDAYYSGSYRWAFGFIAASALTSTYNVTAFPRQSDMPRNLRWSVPHGKDVYDSEGEIVEALDNRVAGYGKPSFKWALGPVTPLMWQWVVTNKFNGLYWAEATIQTWDRDFGWRSVWCIAQRTRASEGNEPGGARGYLSRLVDFVVQGDATG